ncbi:MAG: ATP-binding protein [Gemmatimonadaceae bacterium]
MERGRSNLDTRESSTETGARHSDASRSLILAIACSLLGVVILWTIPKLGHFEGALIPWPAHGIAVAILLAAPRNSRVGVALGIAIASLLGTSVNAISMQVTWLRALSATSQLVGQTVLVVFLFLKVAGERSPLESTTAYSKLLVVTTLGTIPIAALASAILAIAGRDAVPGYTLGSWWVAAATSMGAIVGGLLTILPGAPRSVAGRSLNTLEFAVLGLAYAMTLSSAYWDVPIFGVAMPPAVATLPFLAWAGIRFGVRGFGVIAAALIVAVIVAVWTDVGPFSRLDDNSLDRFRRSWVYLASLIGPAMIFPIAVAERAEAERRARTALAQFQAMIAGVSDLIAAVDRDLVLVAANPSWLRAFQSLYGATLKPGDSPTEAYALAPAHRDLAVGLWRRALAGERFTVDRVMGDPAHQVAEFEVTYSPVLDERGEIVGASQVLRDVTVRRQREAEQAEARRMESVGRLAGGIAHDFNNLMTAVMGYASLVRSSMPNDDPRVADVAEVEKAAMRAGNLTQQLLAFARQRQVQPRVVDLGELVTGLTGLLAPLLGTRLALEVDVEPSLRPVRLDPTQFEQVIMNLAINARDATPDGGRLRIVVKNEERAGTRGVGLSVADDGTGMTDEVRARIFEPFFTTKTLGEGTGLGLATVHGIVHQAGGQITVESSVGVGTTFRLFFPGDPSP